MPQLRINKEEQDRIHFFTFTVKNWYYVFDRHKRFEILEDCFVYCQENKGLKVYAFVFMLNHIHFIAKTPNLINTIRSMRTNISKKLKENIYLTEPSILRIFKSEKGYQFWKSGNYPEPIFNKGFFDTKVEYIHNNPVNKLYVVESEDWLWSSASKVPSKIKISRWVD